jgi:hypothetical protein
MNGRRRRVRNALLFPYTERGMIGTAVLAAIGGSLLALGRIRHELWWVGLGLCVPFIYWFVTAFGVLLPAIWIADWRQRRAGQVAADGRPVGKTNRAPFRS